MPAPWNFASKPGSIEVEKPLGYYREKGAAQQQQQVQEARAGKASIEEVNKERAVKQRVSTARIHESPRSLVPSLLLHSSLLRASCPSRQ